MMRVVRFGGGFGRSFFSSGGGGGKPPPRFFSSIPGHYVDAPPLSKILKAMSEDARKRGLFKTNDGNYLLVHVLNKGGAESIAKDGLAPTEGHFGSYAVRAHGVSPGEIAGATVPGPTRYYFTTSMKTQGHDGAMTGIDWRLPEGQNLPVHAWVMILDGQIYIGGLHDPSIAPSETKK